MPTNKRYDKYNGVGDLHWKEYADVNSPYHCLVDDGLKFFKEKGTVLDVGCGDGVSSFFLAKRGFRVTGIDPEERGIYYANKMTEGLPFEGKVMNIEDFEMKEFDYLYSLDTIEHVADPGVYVEVMKKIKKFGIIITDNNKVHGCSKYHNITFNRETIRELFKDFEIEDFGFSSPYVDRKYIGIKIWQDQTKN